MEIDDLKKLLSKKTLKKQEQAAKDYPNKYSRTKGGKVKIESKDLEEWAAYLYGD